jgi:hypothetical protein
MNTCCLYFFSLIVGACLLMSCQKEIDGLTDGTIIITPADQKPKVGTTWTYQYNWYNAPGAPTNTKIVTHRAKSEETLAGEKWLKIVDMETDTVVYYLNTKIDGLYQYTNASPYLLCKYPASVNDTYTTFNSGSAEFFTVRGVNDTIPTGLGDIPLSKYEGVKNSDIIDLIWYNKNAWIVWTYQYKRIQLPPSPSIYYLYSKMFIESIVY